MSMLKIAKMTTKIDRNRVQINAGIIRTEKQPSAKTERNLKKKNV